MTSVDLLLLRDTIFASVESLALIAGNGRASPTAYQPHKWTQL